jgi:virginiamycin B lyase
MNAARTRIQALGLLLVLSTSLHGYEIKEFPLPANTLPNYIIVGPDGNMWFTEFQTDQIGVITLAGVITHYPQGGCKPIGIALGADGYAWFTCGTPTAGNTPVESTRDFVAYTLSNVPAANGPIAAIPGGICYSTGNGAEVLDIQGNFKGTTSSGFDGALTGLAAGGDGQIWFSQASTGWACYGSLSGSACNMSDPSASAPYGVTWSQMFGAAVFADSKAGLVFFACSDGDPNGLGCGLTAPALGANAVPVILTTAPDGSVWFTDQGRNEIDHLYRNGSGTVVIDHYPVPTPSAIPFGIAVSPDGSVWFTENNGQKIGRLRVHPEGDVNGDGSVDVSDIFYLINYLFAGGSPPK